MLTALLFAACGTDPGAAVVKSYTQRLHAGDLGAAHAMLTPKTQAKVPLEGFGAALHTETLRDTQGVYVRGVRVLDGVRQCVYTQLDFATRTDQGPHGYYIFYLSKGPRGPELVDVRTYDKISGGMVKTTHFDEASEPFPCHSNGL